MKLGIVCTILGGTAAVAGCGGDDATSDKPTTEPAPVLAPPAEGQGFQLELNVTAPAKTEIWKCKVDFLAPGVGFLPINHVESIQNDKVHHMDIMALAFTPLDLEPGIYDCDEIYEQNAVLMEEGIFLYASQAAEQTITLPDSTAAMVPKGMQYMHEIHYVNAADEDIDVFSYVNAYTIPPQDVENSIWGHVVRDANINIPPMTDHTEWTRCVMNEDVDVIFLSSHTHKLGLDVTVRSFDGETVGDELYRNTDWHAPKLQQFAPPMHLKAGEGLEFACNFRNHSPTEVNWGFGADDEMCQIGLVFYPQSSTAECVQVESSDGVLGNTATDS